jgi:hypothetical protein
VRKRLRGTWKVEPHQAVPGIIRGEVLEVTWASCPLPREIA